MEGMGSGMSHIRMDSPATRSVQSDGQSRRQHRVSASILTQESDLGNESEGLDE